MSHYKPYPAYKDSGVEWLGWVPKHWQVRAIRWLSPIQRGASPRPIDDPKYFDDEGEYGWVRIEDVTAADGVILSTRQRLSSLGANLSVKLQPGALFLSIAGSVGKPCVAGSKVCIHDGFVYFPMLRSHAGWLFKIFESRTPFIGLGKLGTQLNLNTETVGSIKVGLPPACEALKILSGLDRETTRIDALIEKKTRFIELLREKRQALITHAVTKGLDPNVKMKDSGVEWLGEVPEHWVVKRFRDISISISTGPFGTALGNEDYITGGVPVINPSHIIDEQCSPDPDITVSTETAQRLSFWTMRIGDLVTARRGELGRAAVISREQDGWICGTGSLRVRPNTKQVLARYLHVVLQSRYARDWLSLASVGATMANLNEGILGSLPLVLPPSINEQEQLLSLLAIDNERLSKIELKATLSVSLLKERRSALITAAVTGQIDLREAV